MRSGCIPAAITAGGLLCHDLSGHTPTGWLTAPQRDSRRSAASPPAVSISGDGRYVAFTSYARLLAADDDSLADIYVLDRATATLTLESAMLDGRPLNGDVDHPSINGDGRYLTFDTVLGGETSRGLADVVLRDRAADSSRRLTTGLAGMPADGWSGQAHLAADGGVVVFASAATNLVPGTKLNGRLPDVYRFDLASQAFERVSVDGRGVPHAGGSVMPSVSGDGRRIAFSSTPHVAPARHLLPPVSPGSRMPSIYLRDIGTGRTILVTGGAETPNAASMTPAISANGRWVVFASFATNLKFVAPGSSGPGDPRDRNKSSDVFLYDVQSGAVTLVSRTAAGATANGASLNPAISADGRWIAFQSDASDLVCGRTCHGVEDVNLLHDVFVFDRVTGEIARLSADRQQSWLEESSAPAIDASGAVVAFSSRHPISAGDVANDFDLFVRLLAQ